MRWTILPALLALAGAAGCGHAGSEPSSTPSERSGTEVYQQMCTICHGADGKLGLSGAKDLTKSTLTHDEMIAIVRDGKGGMMPYGNVLKSKEVDAVVDHVRSLAGTE